MEEIRTPLVDAFCEKIHGDKNWRYKMANFARVLERQNIEKDRLIRELESELETANRQLADRKD